MLSFLKENLKSVLPSTRSMRKGPVLRTDLPTESLPPPEFTFAFFVSPAGTYCSSLPACF